MKLGPALSLILVLACGLVSPVGVTAQETGDPEAGAPETGVPETGAPETEAPTAPEPDENQANHRPPTMMSTDTLPGDTLPHASMPLEEALDGTGVAIAPPPESRAAQVATGSPGATGPTTQVAPSNPPDYAAWAVVATQTEAALEAGNPSSLRLQSMRAALVQWRDVFLNEQSVNHGRIATVETQIEAMGPVPAADAAPEAADVTARRAALTAQLAELRAPVQLAKEAHAHANGLVGEIDTLIRIQQTRALLQRGPSPLNPSIWPDVVDAVQARIVGLWKELNTSIRSTVRHETLSQNWPMVLFYFLIFCIILLRGRRWIGMVEKTVNSMYPRGAGVWRFLMSIAEIAVPLAGLFALEAALNRSGLFGFRATQLIDALSDTGLYVLIARALAGHFFNPAVTNPAPFDFTDAEKAGPRRLTYQMGWVLAALFVALTFINTGNIDPEVRAIVILPFELYLAFVLYRFGRCLRRLGMPNSEPGQTNEMLVFGRRLMILIGPVIMAASVVAPVLTLLGFNAAATAILYPTIQSLALLGLLVLLQWLTFDVHALITGSDSGSKDALLPVVVGFILVLAAIPFVALIWGARVEDLNEIWTQFRDGYQIGDTRISPADLLTFLLIFGAGYMVTRLVQSTLRNSILPKTRIDLGGQNAIVSGMGYIGIFLAAILAITSTGLNLSSLAIVAGALSVGIGFGLQNIVSNFVSGIILLIERPISEGDWIEVGGRMGYVRDISVRSTRIETFDRTDVIVPNADLVSGQVVNWTRGNSVGRVIVPISVPYGSDTLQVKTLLQEIAEAHPMVLLAPPPHVVLVGFGPDVLNYEIRAVVRDVNFGLTVRSQMNEAIAEKFFAEGIEIAGMARSNGAAGRSALNPILPPDEDGGSLSAAPTMAQMYTHKNKTRDADG